MNKLSQKKSNVRRFILISPESYDNFRRSLVITNPEKLNSIEHDFIKIMQNNSLNSVEKLSMYSNILTRKLNKSFNKGVKDSTKQINNYLSPTNRVKKVDQQNQFGSPIRQKKNVESQVSPRKKEYFLPQIHSSMVQDADDDEEEEEEEQNSQILNEGRTPSRFYGSEMYEKFPLITDAEKQQLDHRDYEREREKLYQKMRELANVSDIRNLEFEDPLDKSFIKFRKKGSFTQYGIEKNELSDDDDDVDDEIVESVSKVVKNRKKPIQKSKNLQDVLTSPVSPHKLRSGRYLFTGNRDWIRF